MSTQNTEEKKNEKSQKYRTDIEQDKVQKTIDEYYDVFDEKDTVFYKHSHAIYAYISMHNIGHIAQILDNGQPWFAYWNLHTLSLVNDPSEQIDARETANLLDFLRQCQHPNGGFGGGPGQLPHGAACYGALLALIIMESEEGYKLINRPGMSKFLLSVRHPTIYGSFVMHELGELDLRMPYIVAVATKLLRLPDSEAILAGVGDYIAQCQTHEGGLAAAVGFEAHGGYTFCGVATLALLGELHKLDIPRLLDWLTKKQMRKEGGFVGRTEKAVDACYSFWQGATFKILDEYHGGAVRTDDHFYLFDQKMLQKYLLICAQEPQGGLRDKPGKSPDHYHTSYALAGLSIAQERPGSDPVERIFYGKTAGNVNPALRELDPIFNVARDHLKKAMEYFGTH
jgi:protein farnesyltransferase subunit beta